MQHVKSSSFEQSRLGFLLPRNIEFRSYSIRKSILGLLHHKSVVLDHLDQGKNIAWLSYLILCQNPVWPHLSEINSGFSFRAYWKIITIVTQVERSF